MIRTTDKMFPGSPTSHDMIPDTPNTGSVCPSDDSVSVPWEVVPTPAENAVLFCYFREIRFLNRIQTVHYNGLANPPFPGGGIARS